MRSRFEFILPFFNLAANLLFLNCFLRSELLICLECNRSDLLGVFVSGSSTTASILSIFNGPPLVINLLFRTGISIIGWVSETRQCLWFTYGLRYIITVIREVTTVVVARSHLSRSDRLSCHFFSDGQLLSFSGLKN